MHTPVTQLEQHISITLRCGSACCCKRPVQGHIWPHNCLTLQQTYSWPPSYSEQGYWLLKKGCGAQSLLLHLAWMLLLGPLALLCRLSKGCHLGASLGAGVGAGWVVYTPTCCGIQLRVVVVDSSFNCRDESMLPCLADRLHKEIRT
jgi:hypothetical protein